MADDLLRRLREAASGGDVFVSPGQAADEIQKLQKHIAELEAALQKLLSAISRSDFSFSAAVTVTQAVAEARALVEGKGNE